MFTGAVSVMDGWRAGCAASAGGAERGCEQFRTDGAARTDVNRFMPEPNITILTAEIDGDDGVIVRFSDGTTGAYVIEELLELRPFREQSKTEPTIPISAAE
jgi:hypothetical protein